MNEIDNHNKFNIKKWLPISTLVIFSIALLFYFGTNEDALDDLNGLNTEVAAFYSENLKPLFFKTKLSNEDVFNFALYQNLPIDKSENKIIQIETDDVGNELYEIKEAALKQELNNYEKFSKKLKLNEEEQYQLDSILSEYKDDLYYAVYSDEGNTFAVDTRLGLIQKALSTELNDFINLSKNKNAEKFKHDYSSLARFHETIDEERKRKINDYIVFTPDTVIKTKFVIDRFEIPEIDLVTENIKLKPSDSIIVFIKPVDPVKIKHFDEESIEYEFEHNIVRAVLPESYFETMDIKDYENLKIELDSSANEFKLCVGIDPENEDGFQINFKGKGEDSVEIYNFEFNLDNLEEIINESMKNIGEFDVEDWEEFGLKMDSLARRMERLKIDTIKVDKN